MLRLLIVLHKQDVYFSTIADEAMEQNNVDGGPKTGIMILFN